MRHLFPISETSVNVCYLGPTPKHPEAIWDRRSKTPKQSGLTLSERTLSTNLVDQVHVEKAQVAAIPKGDLLPFFHDKLGMDEFQSRQLLLDMRFDML